MSDVEDFHASDLFLLFLTKSPVVNLGTIYLIITEHLKALSVLKILLLICYKTLTIILKKCFIDRVVDECNCYLPYFLLKGCSTLYYPKSLPSVPLYIGYITPVMTSVLFLYPDAPNFRRNEFISSMAYLKITKAVMLRAYEFETFKISLKSSRDLGIGHIFRLGLFHSSSLEILAILVHVNLIFEKGRSIDEC